MADDFTRAAEAEINRRVDEKTQQTPTSPDHTIAVIQREGVDEIIRLRFELHGIRKALEALVRK